MNPRKYYKRQMQALRIRNATLFLRPLEPTYRDDDDDLHPKPVKTPKYSNPSSSPPILRIPVDVLLRILDHVHPVASVTLALTCKPLYRLLGYKIDHSCWHHKPDPLEECFCTMGWFVNHRWALISHLQSDRWLACTACLTLHPPTHFRPNQILFKDNYSRVCHLGKRSGVVDICPCKKLTFGSKLRLSDKLESQDATGQESFAEHPVWHSCSWSYGKVSLETQVTPYLQGQAVHLGISYLCRWPRDTLLQKQCMRKYICPHVSLKGDILRLMGQTGSCFAREPTHISQWECKTCATACEITAWMEKRKYITFRYNIARNLGKEKLAPDDTWFAQNVLSVASYEDPYSERVEDLGWQPGRLRRMLIRCLSKPGPLWESHVPLSQRQGWVPS